VIQEKEILESSVDPVEWKKECDRVAGQLKIKVTANNTLSSREMEAEEIANRRGIMLDHFKVVREFSKSNIPIMIESLCI
jgi:hypothetical protein